MTRFSQTCLSWWILCGSIFLLSLHLSTSAAKEVQLSSEWTLLGANDTVPAGAHIRMDLTTGEKWVKLSDEDEVQSTSVASSAVAVDGTNENDGASSGTPPPPQQQQQQQKDREKDPDYDFEMMHRTFSKLPPEELERMGGLPELPSASGDKVSASERVAYEARMKQIWTQRQADLQTIQEDVLADLPQVLKNRINSLQNYLEDPATHLALLDLERDPEPSSDGEVTNVISVLKDLEYQLSDLDMARDFYTLGGWPLLVTLLSDSVHLVNQTCDDVLQSKIHKIQSHACWAIGTMVKNAEEFYPFAVEAVSISGQNTTVLSLLVDWFGTSDANNPEPLKQKAMYALGALLRGNRFAQHYFIRIGGSDRLDQSLIQFREDGSTATKVAKRILALADDIVSDVLLHPGSGAQIDKDIIKAFSTETWCDSVLRALSGSDDLQETALKTFQTLAASCRLDDAKARKSIEMIKTTWISDKSMDPDHLKERLVLVETATQAMEKASEEPAEGESN